MQSCIDFFQMEWIELKLSAIVLYYYGVLLLYTRVL